MADKLSIVDKIFLVILCGLLSTIFGCAQSSKLEDSNHYRAQVQQGYPCPSCGHQIPMENISPNIRMENKCPNCGKIFFGNPLTVAKKEKTANYQSRYAPYGPRNYGPTSVYESDTNYQQFLVGGESFKETETGYYFLSWRSRDSKVKSRRVIPHWTTRRYSY